MPESPLPDSPGSRSPGSHSHLAGSHASLLASDEPSPVALECPDGGSPFFLACDHAGKRIPRRLGTLGLADADLDRHIAWDIGAAAVAEELSRRLDATLVMQRYSRLVIDCNRGLDAPDSIATVSESTVIPGNRNLHDEAAAARAAAVFHPYHAGIAEALDRRRAAGRPSVLVAVHSFTPVYKDQARPWHIGILYNRDPRLAHVMLDLLSRDRGLCIGDNQPYRVSDATDYTIPVHGERRGIAHVEIEIRQDLIAAPSGQAEWAGRLAEVLTRSLERLGPLDGAR